MKQSTFNFMCLGVAVVSGVCMFLLKYHVLDKEKELAHLRRQIVNDRRELHLLKADWAVLTDPQHLRLLIKETELRPLQAKQIVQPEELEDRPVSSEEETKKGETDV
ncbi:MAG: hypothetical protein IKQ99_02800 [Alphaproteobacteria bacterium]|nr:hypothetical protein [Alphaproteobacteria bacterium]